MLLLCTGMMCMHVMQCTLMFDIQCSGMCTELLSWCAGGGSGVSAFKHLSHEFLIVSGPADSFAYGGATEYIVDPRFREQFDIPQVCLQAAVALC